MSEKIEEIITRFIEEEEPKERDLEEHQDFLSKIEMDDFMGQLKEKRRKNNAQRTIFLQ